jgi:hypothetical protein
MGIDDFSGFSVNTGMAESTVNFGKILSVSIE